MKIGDLAEKAGLSRDTIRFYERNGLIESQAGSSSTNTYREYPEHLVRKLRFINQAREAGMSVADLKGLFVALEGSCDPEQARQVLQERIDELESSIKKTRAVIQFLKRSMLSG